MNSPTLSIIIPCYNEERIMQATILKLANFLKEKEFTSEVILVNDGSQDATLDIINNTIKSTHSTTVQWHILTEPVNQGKGYAIKKGVLTSTGKWIVYMDADLSVCLETLHPCKEYLQQGFDAAIGSKYLKGSHSLKKKNPLRLLFGKGFNLSVKLLLNLKYADTQCGFKCFNRKVVDEIFPHLTMKDFTFDVEFIYLLDKCHFKIKEVPVTWEYSPHSKVHLIIDSIKMMRNLIQIKKLYRDVTSLTQKTLKKTLH